MLRRRVVNEDQLCQGEILFKEGEVLRGVAGKSDSLLFKLSRDYRSGDRVVFGQFSNDYAFTWDTDPEEFEVRRSWLSVVDLVKLRDRHPIPPREKKLKRGL